MDDPVALPPIRFAELVTNRRAAEPFRALTADQRLGLLAGLAALP